MKKRKKESNMFGWVIGLFILSLLALAVMAVSRDIQITVLTEQNQNTQFSQDQSRPYEFNILVKDALATGTDGVDSIQERLLSVAGKTRDKGGKYQVPVYATPDRERSKGDLKDTFESVGGRSR